jgi:hypothetical protein
MAKLIMNTRMNIPKSALFLELGWEPVYTFMNRQRARSFKREASKLKSSDKYNCLPIETRQLLYIDRLLLDNTFPNSLCLTD